MSGDPKTLGAAIQKTGEVMTQVGTELQGASPDVGPLAVKLTQAAEELTNALPKAEEEAAGIPSAVKADGADADGNHPNEEEEAAREKRRADIGEPTDGTRLTDASEKYIKNGGAFPAEDERFEPDLRGGGKKKKRRGGKSQRAWKKNKKGGRQSKKRR